MKKPNGNKNGNTAEDNFFSALANTKPYFKAGFQGFAGSGKTYTAALVAVGLHQLINSKKPIVIFDTERASKFLKALFADKKIDVLVRESRSMADLALTMAKLRRGGIADLLIIDSITHVWDDFVESYKRRVGRVSLQFQDWGIIKPTWKKEFSDVFVTDPYHILMTGRAGFEYDYEKNEETGRKELHKTGIKMKVEGETAYEPDMLVLMERYEEVLGRKKRVWREATIVKDRSTVLDGKTFEDPTFEDFAPAIRVMLANAKKPVTQAEGDSAALFKTEEEKMEWAREKKKALEEIEGYLVAVWPSVSIKDKQMKASALYQAFGTRSWTAVEELSPEELRTGYKKIVAFVEGIKEQERSVNGKPAGNSTQVVREAA